MTRTVLFSCAIVLALCGCDDEGGESNPAPGGSTTEAEDSFSDPDDESSSGAGGGDSSAAQCEEVPTSRAALEAWLADANNYLDFEAESEPHPSTGPHFGAVRTFVNDCLAESLAAGNDEHPLGSASVKELFGSGGGTEPQGYSVMVKVEPGASEGWYWYEGFNGSVFGDSVDDGTCIGCHSSGQGGFRTPWPLE